MRNILNIFIIIIHISIIFSKKKYDNLDEACKVNSIICSINQAINNVFFTYQYQEKNILKDDDDLSFKITSLKIHFIEPKCDKIEYFINNNNNSIIKYNCSILIISDLYIGIMYNNEIDMKNYLMEFLVDEFKFIHKQNSHQIQFEVKFNKNIINYNKNEPLFQIPSIKEKIENEFKLLSENLKHLYINDITNKFSISDVNTNFEIVFNFLYNNGPFYFIDYNKSEENKQKITFLSYDSFNYNNYIITLDTIFISNFSITFEYAINYDIDYNEGFFILSDFAYTKNQNFSNSSRFFEFNNLNHINLNNQKFIVEQFFLNLNIAIENYTKINKNS